MLKSKTLDDISARIGEAIAHSPARDIEKNVRALLTGAFSRLDLVSREEFEVPDYPPPTPTFSNSCPSSPNSKRAWLLPAPSKHRR